MTTPEDTQPPEQTPGASPEFLALDAPDRAAAEALGADFEDDTPREADHG